MPFVSRLREEFSFIKGNYAVLVLSWILMDFAMELPGTYYSLYVLELGATETILGMIGFSSFSTLLHFLRSSSFMALHLNRHGLDELMSNLSASFDGDDC